MTLQSGRRLGSLRLLTRWGRCVLWRFGGQTKPSRQLLVADALRRVGTDPPAGQPWIAWDGCVLRSGHIVADRRNFGHGSDMAVHKDKQVSDFHR